MTLIKEDISLLIGGCKKNDRKAQELLYRKFYVAMAALCARYTRNEQDAMQVLNDGFLKVFRHIESYDSSKATIYTWIRKIMINTALDFIKNQQILKTLEPGAFFPEASVENSAVPKMDADELLGLVRKLPLATQVVFNLYSIDGYKHSEIAAILGISEGTSRWHFSEARKQLKQSIALLQKMK